MLKKWIATGIIALLIGGSAVAQVETDIKSGERVVSAMTAGQGDHVVIALHGGSGTDRRFFFSDMGGQMGQKLARAGFRVIAINWAGQAGGGFHEVGVAIAYAKETGAQRISLMGHSRGGELAANYARQQDDGAFDTVIQLASVDDQGLPMTKTKKLFAFNKYDKHPMFQAAAYEKSAEPKRLIELGGSGHAVSALIKEKPDFVRDVVMLLRK